MAAPTPTNRTLPSGDKMPDGFKSLVTLSLKASIQLWEKDNKPPAVDGGEPIDTTTMHNISWRTKRPRSLKTLDPFTIECAYDPDVIIDILAQINKDQTITFTFPDYTTWAFYGYMQKWDPAALKEGEFPMASVTLVPTNWDAASNVEAAPVLTAAAGT